MSSEVKKSGHANYETTFQLFHCQQTQSLLITLYILKFLLFSSIFFKFN
jgi:hypothetical protein